MLCPQCKKEMRLIKSDFKTNFGEVDLTIHNNDVWKCNICGKKVFDLNKYARIQEIGYKTYKEL